MAVINYTDPPVFSDSASGKPRSFGAPEYMIMRENAIILDQLSYRGRRAWLNQVYRLDAFQSDPSPLGGAAFQYRTGLTTLTLQLSSDTAGDTYKVYLAGVLRNSTTTVVGVSTIAITISGLGFTDYDIIDVIVNVARPIGGPRTYDWLDAYVSPASGITNAAGSWPGVPTFGTLNASNLNQLATCERWVFERLNNTVQPAFMQQRYRYAQSNINTGDIEGRMMIWSGSVSNANGCDRLRIIMAHETLTTPAEKIQVFINGSLVATSATFAAYTSGNFNFSIDISAYTASARLDVRIDHVVTTEATGDQLATRWLLTYIDTYRASYTFASPPAVMAPRDSLTFATLKTRLNALSTIILNSYNRIAGATDVFDRIRLFRQRPVQDAGANAYFQHIYIGAGTRVADALWVKGKGLKIAFGTIKRVPTKEDPFAYEFQYNEALTQGDAIEQRLTYFDAFSGMYSYSRYQVLGEQLNYLAEQLQ